MIQNRFVCDRCGSECSDNTYFTIDFYGHDINPSGDNRVALDTVAQNVCMNTIKMFGAERNYCKWCKEQIELFSLKVPIPIETEQHKVSILKKMFCKHKNREVVCWHWTHGETTNEIRFIEIQYRCKDCGKYYFKYLKNWVVCEHFAKNHKDKRWSDDCKPVL